jgi:hypothetical protein
MKTKKYTLKAGTERVSYVEEKKNSSALRLLAAAKQTNVSSLIREATKEYLAREDPDQSLSRVAEQLAQYKADSKEERAEIPLDPGMQKKVLEIIQKYHNV